MTKRKSKTNGRKSNPDLIPRQAVETAIAVSTRHIMEAGATVLASQYGFTDKQVADWIDKTWAIANEELFRFGDTVTAVNEKLRAKE
jgi:hypothetical protein